MVQKVSFRLITALAIFAILLTACGGGNKLVGDWEYVEPNSGITVTITFTSDKLSFSAPGMDPIEATYKVVDDDTLSVIDPDSGEESETSYTLDGDKLMIDFGGEKVEFTKAK